MAKFSYNVTNLIDYESELIDVELNDGDAREFAVLVANQLLSDRPDLTHRGMAIAIYDDKAGLFPSCRSTTFNSFASRFRTGDRTNAIGWVLMPEARRSPSR